MPSSKAIKTQTKKVVGQSLPPLPSLHKRFLVLNQILYIRRGDLLLPHENIPHIASKRW
jgi:hypothetical protein